MLSNLERYKDDLNKLIEDGESLLNSMQMECYPEEFEEALKKLPKGKKDKFKKSLPSFTNKYQTWYSESLILIKLLLPDRISDFTILYEKPRTKRKDITHDNYVIEDYLKGLTVTSGSFEKTKIVGPDSAIPCFKQQLNILSSVKRRFTSSLFDIKQLVQSDVFDSELEASKELCKKGFLRGSGAIAGVVLEKHLSQVCENHKISITKKNPSISDLNDKLKQSKIYETPTWRKVQLLGDLRNLCDHNKTKEPNANEVMDLITGVETIIKTIF